MEMKPIKFLADWYRRQPNESQKRTEWNWEEGRARSWFRRTLHFAGRAPVSTWNNPFLSLEYIAKWTDTIPGPSRWFWIGNQIVLQQKHVGLTDQLTHSPIKILSYFQKCWRLAILHTYGTRCLTDRKNRKTQNLSIQV